MLITLDPQNFKNSLESLEPGKMVFFSTAKKKDAKFDNAEHERIKKGLYHHQNKTRELRDN